MQDETRKVVTYMNAIQPFFVLSTKQYRKGIISQFGIAHFYNYLYDMGDNTILSAIPDGCVDIMLRRTSKGMEGVAAGTVLESKQLLYERNKEYFGVRFLPGVLPAILNVPFSELVNQEIDIWDVICDKDILKRVEEGKTMEESMDIFMQMYKNSFVKKENGHANTNEISLPEWICEEIMTSEGNLTVYDIANKAGYSTRYIDQIFSRQFGFTPKTFSKIMKFQTTIQEINRDFTKNFTDICLEKGYYDQSHFIKDFKKFVSVTPHEYKQMLMEHDYSKRLEIVPVRHERVGIE